METMSKKNLYDTSKMLAEKYGEYATPEREVERAKALAWYFNYSGIPTD